MTPTTLPPALPPWTSPDMGGAGGRGIARVVDLMAGADDDMTSAIEQEVSALLADLQLVKQKAARAEANAERLKQENGYLQQQVQLEMSSSHRSKVEQQRLQELLQRSQGELEASRRHQLQQQHHDDITVPLEVYDALQCKAIAQLQRARDITRWKRVFKLWGMCKCALPLSQPLPIPLPLPLRFTVTSHRCTSLTDASIRFRRKASAYKASHWKRKAIARAYMGWKRMTKMCRVFAVVFNQMGLFSQKERLGEFFTAWRQQVASLRCVGSREQRVGCLTRIRYGSRC